MKLDLITDQFPAKGSGLPRSDASTTGLIHASEVIKYCESKIYGAKDNDWNLPIAAEVGFLWEEVYSRAFADRYTVFRPDEIEKDGLVCSPDGITFDPLDGSLCDEEYKATWRSVNKTPDKIWYWMMQFKTYCHMLDTRVTMLKALYVMGNYKGSGPQYREFRIEFTSEEIADTWQLVYITSLEMKRNKIWTFSK